jgi:hypothetical protein
MTNYYIFDIQKLLSGLCPLLEHRLFIKLETRRAECPVMRGRKLRIWIPINYIKVDMLFVKKYYPELLPASEGALGRWCRLYLHSLAPTNPHWARVVCYGYGPFCLCVIHKEGLCPSSRDINKLMMMMLFVRGIRLFDKLHCNHIFSRNYDDSSSQKIRICKDYHYKDCIFYLIFVYSTIYY